MKNKIGRKKQLTRKGRYFIYVETEFYASRRSCSGIGHQMCIRDSHMDEATPHLHIDFIPFTTGSKRGLSTRVSLKQALADQGHR